MKITIEQVTPEKYDIIYSLIRTAFETAKVKDGDEQDYTVGLRNSARYIPELELVAVEDKTVIGHIMLTCFPVNLSGKSPDNLLLLAPLSVLLEYRSRGIGTALVERAINKAEQEGYKAIFLCGDPAYYSRFGFKPTTEYGIDNCNDIPAECCMVKELIPGSLKELQGTIDFYG